MSETVAAPPRAEAPETFCRYLVRQFMAKKGFRPGTVPEAQELIAASDYVLTLADGVSFIMLCLIDREADPHRTFDLPLAQLERIADQCLTYAPKVGSRSMPVVIRVIEVGPTSTARWHHLQDLKTRWLARKCSASAIAVDPQAGTVLSNSRLARQQSAFIETLLRAPRETDIKPFVAVALPPPSPAYVTWGLMALLALVFALELVFAIEPPTGPLEPGIRTLTALGGLQYLLVVDQGQWWRVFTAPLLHANLVHILLNGVALWLAGVALERAVGRLWFAAIFVIGALGGAGGSLLINPTNLISVGASGAIMGLFAAMFVSSFHYTSAVDRTNLQRRAMQVLIPSLLPLANVGHAGKVDYGAHAGGAVAGAIAGYVLLMLWREADVMPGFRKAAMAIMALGVLGSIAGASAVSMKYQFWQATTHIIPTEQLPKKDTDINAVSAERYVTNYPTDPRSHYYKAIFLLRTSDLAAAERELRVALDQHAILDQVLTPSFKHAVQGLLALVLSEERRTDEARQMAASACSDSSVPFAAKLKASGLCPAPQ